MPVEDIPLLPITVHRSPSAPWHPDERPERPRPNRQRFKMKYEQQLLFNSQSEWTDHYIAYSTLKSAVYKFEKEALQYRQPGNINGDVADEERGSLLANTSHKNNDDEDEDTTSSVALSAKFRALCDTELAKIESFYKDKEGELLESLNELKEEVEQVEEEGAFGEVDDSDEESGESGDEDGLLQKGSKLLRAVVNAATTSGGNTTGKRRESSLDEERNLNGNGAALSSRRRSSSLPPRARKRSQTTASEVSEGSSTDALQRVPSTGAEALPSETVQEIENQMDRTMQAATSGGTSKSQKRRRASSFGTDGNARANAGGSTNDVWSSNSRHAIDMRITFKLRLQGLFRDLSQLKEYVSLNQTGFRKILKKFDKVTSSSLQKQYMSSMTSSSYPFLDSTQTHLDEALQSVIPLYAKIVTRSDTTEALRQLRIQLREHVVWERNTIWREMIGLERKGWAGGGGRRMSGAGDGGGNGNSGTAGDKPIVMQKEIETAHGDTKDTYLRTPLGRFKIPRWITKETVGGSVALLAFVSILASDLFDRVEERNCLAILVLASIFWAMEVIPLFATSLLVPFLIVVLRVLRSTDGHDHRLTATEASKYIFSQMFTGTIVLLVGGFTLAGALSKQNIDKILASRVLSLAGTKPATVLIAYMGVACFASMWISNVAAPVLCFSLIQPILRTLPSRSTYSKALVLGIALASNLGGMASPIASPQNLIAISYMNEPLSWAQWFAVSLPVAGISIFAIWGLLCWLYRWDKDITINPVRPTKEKFTSTQWFVCAVTLATVALLCVEHQLEGMVGDMGIIALIPLVIFFGTGILRKQDFDNFPWSIVFLAMGGIALGKGVLSSGLLADLDTLIEEGVQGLDVWPILAIFSLLALIVATFVSHSIASVLVAPIAAQIGQALNPPHPRLLIMATALICSAGMGLPVSGFPNLMAVNLEDEVGNRYLTVNDFLKAGIPASLIATTIIITVGYLLMKLIGL